MKREFLEKIELEGGAKLPKEVIDAIMGENGKDIEAAKTTITAERDSLKSQLDTVQQSLKQFEGVDVKELQGKITTLQSDLQQKDKEYQEKIAGMKYEAAVNATVADMKFTSASAKKAFVRDLTDKKLQLENDKLLGFDDFVKAYKESDPDAFPSDDDDGQLVAIRGGGSPAKAGATDALRAAFGLSTDKK